MQKIELGKVIEDRETKRDATHIAVLPVIIHKEMVPGTRVSVNGDYTSLIGQPIGIIDPFLPQKPIPVGTCVWLFMFPNTVTNLRHDWSHPSVPEEFYGADEYDNDGCNGC